jgi:hypothetical protein
MEQKKGALYKCKKPLKKNTPGIKQLLIIPLFLLGFPNIGTRDGEWMRKDDIRRVDDTSMNTH